MMQTGLKGTAELYVTAQLTAESVGSGSVPVLATPMMIALMEAASLKAIDGKLTEDRTTVGTDINIQHTAATPIGSKVKAHAVLTNIEGRRLFFKVEAFDEVELIGRGTHVRFIIDKTKFLNNISIKIK